mmetsp:Transcript_8084/g.15289  ORF Transcript_8084/g.15289 Transcript_8084/m.15289 type:complete len:138 (-) Transcript_8084:239-652(-)
MAKEVQHDSDTLLKEGADQGLSPRSVSSDKSTAASAEHEAFPKTSFIGADDVVQATKDEFWDDEGVNHCKFATKRTLLPDGWGCLRSPLEQLQDELQQYAAGFAAATDEKHKKRIPICWGMQRSPKEELYQMLVGAS